MKNEIDYHMKDERGGALLLALIASVILSLTAISMLRKSQTETSFSYNHYHAKSALFAADAGINQGIDTLKNSQDPLASVLSIDHTVHHMEGVKGANVTSQNVRSGTMELTETGPQTMSDINDLQPLLIRPPFPAGYNLTGFAPPPSINLIVTSRIFNCREDSPGVFSAQGRPLARKELQSTVVILAQQSH